MCVTSPANDGEGPAHQAPPSDGDTVGGPGPGKGGPTDPYQRPQPDHPGRGEGQARQQAAQGRGGATHHRVSGQQARPGAAQKGHAGEGAAGPAAQRENSGQLVEQGAHAGLTKSYKVLYYFFSIYKALQSLYFFVFLTK